MECGGSHQKNDVHGDQAKRHRVNELCMVRKPVKARGQHGNKLKTEQRLRTGNNHPCLGQ